MLEIIAFLFISFAMGILSGIILLLIGSFGNAMKGDDKYPFTALATAGAKLSFACIILLGVHNIIFLPFLYQMITGS